jgi:hypothetical protein
MYPVPVNDALTHRQLEQARRDEARAARDVFRYRLETRKQAECASADIQAAADVSRVAVDEEMAFLDHGLASAAGSAAKVELVAHAAQRLAAIDDRVIRRWFGSGW